METPVDPAPGVRAPLSRERVLRAGLELADAEGLGALSMRRLAQALGVEAMSLYHHVASKSELLEGMVDLVLAEVELPAPDADWQAGLRASAISAHDALTRHSWATGLVGSLRVRPARLRFMEDVLGTLRRAGFSPAQTELAYHAIDSHITGFTLWQGSFSFESAEELAEQARSFMQTIDAEAFPYLVEHIEQHLAPATGVSTFEFGLDLILDGLARLIERDRHGATSA